MDVIGCPKGTLWIDQIITSMNSLTKVRFEGANTSDCLAREETNPERRLMLTMYV